MAAAESLKIPVEEELIRELGSRYTGYRSAIAHPFDPVSVLGLTGQVLEPVKHILAFLDQPGAILEGPPHPAANK
ncbi:hypothetical protein [Arthrobacter sp. ISL-95]|uniref:hypothetical protein n=1 Tax=Arthrobacter sp. ISL-95 TaxID=2819116 RepID=UPI001BEA3DC9|nr:hypothetical protein [Arthrobacter sp. ISL-95]MBT2588369.1 hypothetical protein [Arthrobacter sp. ISL-95]